MKIKYSVLFFLAMTFSVVGQIKHGLRDEQGRHIIPRGYVVVTNDGEFTSDDYLRMVRMGANYQVIRLELGKLSTFPGAKLDNNYLLKLDNLVNLGKKNGIKTVFKMTVYGVEHFSWEQFWLNQKQEYTTYIDAWKLIWNRYKNENFVLGYDVVNEPRKLTMDISYDDLTAKYLVPLYQKIIDESQKINPNKKVLIQSIFMNKGEGMDNNQYAEITTAVNRKNVVFAPHIYQSNMDLVKPVMDRFDRESTMLNAPIFIGEWGFPTFAKTDTLISGKVGQLKYTELYMRTAEVFDEMGVGSIKAWFSGNPKMQNFMSEGPSTWAIFSDKNAIGTVERKYITDIIARPYPQTIAGDILKFKFDFASRTLHVNLKSDNSKGTSVVFVGANRHYPDGFSIICDDAMILTYDPIKKEGLQIVKNNTKATVSDFVWDEMRQQLTIKKWPEDQKNIHFKIAPGIVKK
ncbi:cellulase family glycosylhydrolase [Flavobacterium sp. NG2]|uniref:cellulase family glycosylhydrolase n=1 Tax=Flavobacterium sp. NG2 TaxID=3097547 RepID=UPI002A7F441C|nr:cellulase family glycosylhydrolase [Flavobacterium sp. NG2]WPR70096.1 cellulase family glycosylhydrolase [Flavobacterium sp. NG2]